MREGDGASNAGSDSSCDSALEWEAVSSSSRVDGERVGIEGVGERVDRAEELVEYPLSGINRVVRMVIEEEESDALGEPGGRLVERLDDL